MENIKIGIIGSTGYTGSELVRMLLNHPYADIRFITSESYAGKRFSDVHKQFKGVCDMELIPVKEAFGYDIDVAFLALPHGVSQEFVKENINADYKIIDLSGDFRLSSADVYEEWYKAKHIFPEGIDKAVFGSPELLRGKIKSADLIANPGCFVTSVILGFAPLLKEGLVKMDSLIADSKTGVTGAGIKPKDVTHFPNVNDNFKAYGLKRHRHTVEMQESLSSFIGEDIELLFTPHLLPVDRGILSTLYAKPVSKIREADIRQLFNDFYINEPFVRIINENPEIKNVRGTNYCDIFVNYDNRTNNIFVLSAIDNLVKGASGQAIQNMNIMFGVDEHCGLPKVALCP